MFYQQIIYIQTFYHFKNLINVSILTGCYYCFINKKENMQVYRNLSIDLVKIVAMFGVMCLHTTQLYFIPGVFCFTDILFESAVISIPLFFMVSGYLLLGRENADYRYAFRKVIGIIRFVSIIVFTFWLARSVYHLQFDFVELFKSLVYPYIQRGQFGVFWYFGAMIILYLLYPIINTIYNRHRNAYYALLSTTLLASYTMFISNLLWGGYSTPAKMRQQSVRHSEYGLAFPIS